VSGSPVDELARVIHSGSVALILGGTDTGKTTLIRALHQRVGGEIVDGDVGQAWLVLAGARGYNGRGVRVSR
jgi:polynucleotide 5'-kinase involved in rRNA processing